MIGEVFTDETAPQRGPAQMEAQAQPMRVRMTRVGSVKLAFYHPTRALPAFRVTISHDQWKQIAETLAKLPAGVQDFQAFFGFNDEQLALHRIEAVPMEGGGK